MRIAVQRSKAGTGLTLRTSATEGGAGDYDKTIHPGESALGFTYEEWDAAVGSQQGRQLELTEEGMLRPADAGGGTVGPA